MKTFQLLVAVTILLSGTFNFTNGTANPWPDKKPRVLIRITFGSPPPDCTRLGICQIELLPGILRAAPGQANAQCTADDSGSRLYIEIDTRNGIDAGTLKQYFDNGYFKIETAVPISDEFARALQIRSGSMILPGTVEVAAVNGILTFTVQVK
jgi:hypothetical protein